MNLMKLYYRIIYLILLINPFQQICIHLYKNAYERKHAFQECFFPYCILPAESQANEMLEQLKNYDKSPQMFLAGRLLHKGSRKIKLAFLAEMSAKGVGTLVR